MDQLVLLMQTQMQQQQKQQQEMMKMIQMLASSNQQKQSPPTAAPETPVLQQQLQQPTPSPRRSPRHIKRSPSSSSRRSPRLAEKNSPRLKRERSLSNDFPKKKKIKQLKRSLSYDKAFRADNRMQKSQKTHMMRKALSLRLAPLEDKLLNGDFHDPETKKFKQDYFFDEVSPIVYSITGPPEDCSDEDLPHQCLVMAKDILKKRKQYLDRKKKSSK